jgi:uncharacterized protein YndB with AHSA1/START domain
LLESFLINKTESKREISCQITAGAPLKDVWRTWTTEEGAKSSFAPDCRIDLKLGGAYEMLFNLDAPPGEQGGEGMLILAIQPEKTLSFTWNAPPKLPAVRGQMTHVVVQFKKINPQNTLVTLHHDGWGEGGE